MGVCSLSAKSRRRDSDQLTGNVIIYTEQRNVERTSGPNESNLSAKIRSCCKSFNSEPP